MQDKVMFTLVLDDTDFAALDAYCSDRGCTRAAAIRLAIRSVDEGAVGAGGAAERHRVPIMLTKDEYDGLKAAGAEQGASMSLLLRDGLRRLFTP